MKIVALFTMVSLGASACSGGVSSINNPPGSDGGAAGAGTSTSSVSAATVASVCTKYDELVCAQPNCVADLTLAQSECAGSDAFQQLLDCLASTTIECSGSPPAPDPEQCTAQLLEAEACAGTASSSPGSPGSSSPGSSSPGGSGVLDAGSTTSTSLDDCQGSGDCTAWPCSCSDGYETSLAVCSSGTCQGPVYVCSTANASAVNACASHGGIL